MAVKILLPRATGLIRAEEQSEQSEEVRISCYDNQVPAFAGLEIDRLYGHLYCSPSYFEIANELAGACTYVARQRGVPIAVLLYRHAGNEVTALNDYAKIDDREIHRFADYMFRNFGSVHVISFRKLRAEIPDLAFPWHAIKCTEDMVITLPSTVKEYETAMGKNMRRNIKRYTNALVKDFPSYRYRVYSNSEILERDVRDIIALSCTRLKSKNIEPRFNEKEIRWIVDYAKKCGIVVVATIDGRVCGGIIGFRMGENYFMHVVAHDLRYNDYSLGILCYYHAICESIVRGGKRCHLLQGRYGYKYRLLAHKQDIVHLDLYRSRFHLLLHAHRWLKKELRGRIWLAKQWLLHDVERKEGAGYRYIARAVGFLRKLKRSRGHAEINEF
jgi:hypothetical protein